MELGQEARFVTCASSELIGILPVDNGLPSKCLAFYNCCKKVRCFIDELILWFLTMYKNFLVIPVGM